MDCFLQLLKAFILETFVLGVFATLSEAMPCNLATEYPVQNNSQILVCISCPTCLPGWEPLIRCGTTVGNDAVLGKCEPCKNGKFSPETDQKSCQACQIPLCLKHEIVQENCTDTYDASRCTGICEDGYFMNIEKTKCKARIRKKPTQASNKTNITRVLPTTDEEHKEESQMSDWQIALAVIGTLALVTFALIAVRWLVNRMNTREKKVNEVRNFTLPLPKHLCADNDSNSSNELLDESRKLVKQDKEDFLGKDVTASRPHCLETPSGYEKSAPTVLNNVGCNCNSSNISSDHGVVQFGMKVTVSEPAPLKSPVPGPCTMPHEPMSTVTAVNQGRPACVAPARHIAQPMVQQNNAIHNQAPDMMKFKNWPKKTYDKICREINNSVAPGKDWDALAGNLGFSVEDARDIKNQTNKTDVLICSWMSHTENTVAKFIDILNDMSMTCLAEYIHNICETNGYF